MAFLCGVTAFAAPEKAPKEWGKKLVWQQTAEVMSRPGILSAANMTDGDPRTVASFTQGIENGGEFTVKFPKPITVTMVRFMQRGLKATHYRLWTLPEGTNAMVVAQDRTDEKAISDEWIELPVNRKVVALRFEGIAGEVGYRAAFPQIAEFEIYSTEGLPGGLPVVNAPILRTCEELPMPDLSKTTFDFRVCTDWWNYDMNGWEKRGKEKGVKIEDWPEFKNRISDFRELGITSVRVFAESEACDNYSSFPLEGLPPEKQYDWMKPWAEAMHKNGLKVYYFSHAWRVPIQQAGRQPPMPWLRWDFPYMASDALVGVNENYKDSPMYPCLLTESHFLDKWTTLLSGALKAGVDGVYLMPDEYYYKGHNLSRCSCKSCQKAFKEMFGYDELPKLQPAKVANNAQGQVMPPVPVDTEQYRKWKLFEYQKLADLFTEVGRRLKKQYPNAQYVFSENEAAASGGNCWLENTLCIDKFGANDAFTQKQCYGNFCWGADKSQASIVAMKHFAAAFGESRLLSSSGWGPADLRRPAQTYQNILADVMLGAKRLEVYRLNYMQDNNGLSIYKRLFRMVRLLEKWGLFNTETPNDVGLVYSRASDDWWFVKANALIDPSARSKATDFNLHLADESINKVNLSEDGEAGTRYLSQERVRGFAAQQTVETVLAENGFAYSVVFAERPDNMKNLKRFKTLVIPFAYSLSKDAAAEIAKAADAGTKVVIFGQLGPTDEYGTPYPEPALTNLFGKPGVTYVPGNPGDRAGDFRKRREWAELVAKNVDGGVRVWNNGGSITAIARKSRDNRGWLVYLCNSAMYPDKSRGFSPTSLKAQVVISLPVADGNYRIDSFSSDDSAISALYLNDKRDIAADELKKFAVGLAPQEVKLMRIFRK